MNMMEELSDDQVADQITTWAGRVAAGEARLLGLIAEFDRREAWAGPGMLSCAHWLSWRVGMGLKAAHERVRVARALADLAPAFAAGQLSWTQMRATTRVATTADEASWLHWARHATGAQLERLVIRLRLTAADGALVLAALDHARAALDHQHQPARDATRDASESSAEDSPPQSTVAAGVVELARIGLQAMGSTRPEAARRARSPLIARVDPLSGWARLADGELLPPGSLPALDTPGWRLRPLVGADLTRYDLGRTQRLPSVPDRHHRRRDTAAAPPGPAAAPRRRTRPHRTPRSHHPAAHHHRTTPRSRLRRRRPPTTSSLTPLDAGPPIGSGPCQDCTGLPQNPRFARATDT